MEDKFFTIEEVTRYLKIPKSTIYKLSQKGKIPSSKIGKQLRFRKSSLDKWLAEKESGTRSHALETFLAIDKESVTQHKSRHVLLIDDDQLVLRAITKFLENQGYIIESAQSGEDALGKIKKINFDLIIADVRMPGMDGIETIKKIREFQRQHKNRLVPEIIITGYMDSEAERNAKKLGITDYVYKPFAINDFIKTVKEKIESSSGVNK